MKTPEWILQRISNIYKYITLYSNSQQMQKPDRKITASHELKIMKQKLSDSDNLYQ